MNNVFKTLTTILVLMCSFIANAAWTVRYQHTDTLGSVIAESNSQGTITQRFDYKPFGEGTPTQKAGVGYTGHLEDTDLGLTYMQQRYYDPVIGRFYSNDPIGFRDTHSFNRYSYVGNNPYKYTDPTGMTRESSYQRCEDDPFCENLIPQGSLRNTAEELKLLANGNVVGYYQSRLTRGDHYAKLALNVVKNVGILAKSANAWMFRQVAMLSNAEKSALLSGGSYVDFIRRVNVGLAEAHARFVDADTQGTLGLLSADQISTYHEQFFESVGLPATTFGGSFFFGVRTSYWCDGCDSVP